MIHMRMCQENIIDLRIGNRQRNILKNVHPLLHAVIHQNALSARLQVMTAPGHLMVRTHKDQFHPHSPFRFPPKGNPYSLILAEDEGFVYGKREFGRGMKAAGTGKGGGQGNARGEQKKGPAWRKQAVQKGIKKER